MSLKSENVKWEIKTTTGNKTQVELEFIREKTEGSGRLSHKSEYSRDQNMKSSQTQKKTLWTLVYRTGHVGWLESSLGTLEPNPLASARTEFCIVEKPQWVKDNRDKSKIQMKVERISQSSTCQRVQDDVSKHTEEKGNLMLWGKKF